MYKIYHNPKCKKSRDGLAYIKTKSTDLDIKNYLVNGISAEEVREILLKSNLKPIQFIRLNDDYFKTYLKGKNFSDDEWVQIIVQNPKILQRPIIVSNHRATLANTTENIDKLFKK